MSHGKVMMEMVKKEEPMSKNWAKVLKEDMKLDKKDMKMECKSKALSKMKK